MTSAAKEFDLENFDEMESKVLNEIEMEGEKEGSTPFEIESLGPVNMEQMDEDKSELVSLIIYQLASSNLVSIK